MSQATNKTTVDEFRLTPENTCLETLSPSEAAALFEKSRESIHPMLERCVLAVLNSGEESDDVKTMLEKYKDFRLEVNRTAAGIELTLYNAPDEAFVTYAQFHQGKKVRVHKIIEGVRQNIFAVLNCYFFRKPPSPPRLGSPPFLSDSSCFMSSDIWLSFCLSAAS